MDRSREARSSSSIVASNGTSRRRNRTAGFRDLPEEGQMELQETIRLKERASKRDRDRDLATRSKRRRGAFNKEEELEEGDGDTSVEDTVADGDSDEVEDGGGVSRILSSATASSASNQNQRRNYLPPRVAKQQWKVADDAMIGVPVPRKARSASVKRSHDCTVSGNSGVGGAGEDIADDQSYRNPSDSPARSSAEVVSPSTSIISMKKKMKQTGPKTRKAKTSKGLSSSAKEGDIEIEIAEVLYGLMKQSQCSEKQEANGQPPPNQATEDSSDNHGDSKSSVALTTENLAQVAGPNSVSHHNNGDFSDRLLSVAVEKSKVGHDSSLAQNDLSDGAAKGGSEQPTEMEICPPKLEAASDFSKNLGADGCNTEVTKPEETVLSTGGDEIKGSKKTELTQEELAPCSKLDIGLKDSLPSKSITEAEIKKEEKYKFDLMAPPTSPERDGLAKVSDVRHLSLRVGAEKETSNKVEDKVEGFKEREKAIDEVEDKAVKNGKKIEFFKLDLEKPQKQQFEGTAGKVERNESSTSVRLPITLGGWPTAEIPTVGCMPPVPMERVGKSSTKLQHPNFILSHPRPKRCLTHYDIARNIYLHQQFTKTNYSEPAADASASLAEGKLKKMSSSENRALLGNNLNSVSQRERATADFPVNDKSKQLVFQQMPGTSFSNSASGPGFMFPISQHQTQIATTGNQPGSTKSSNSTSLFNNPEAGKHESLSALPAASSNMSYSQSGLVSVEAPYYAKLQNSGYPFTFSTPAGPTTYRSNTAQAVPLYSGSFYPSQMFYPSQVQPQQNLSQTQSHGVQSIHQSSGLLSHKQPPVQQQQWSVQMKKPMEPHLPLSNQSRKHENETTGEDTATSVSDSQTPQLQKNVYGQNFMLPVQALNFTLMPSATLSNANCGSHGEKKLSHPQHLKSTVALVPSQALTMSFASFSGNGTTSTLNFTPTAQNSAVYQSHPSVQRAGFQVSAAPQPTKQKNHQTSEGRNGDFLSNNGNSGKASATSGQTLVFNNSTRTLNFMSSPAPENWPPPTVKTAALTTNRPPAGSPPGSQQQQQLLQLQQQRMLLQSQATMMPRTKAPTKNSVQSASITTKFPYNAPCFSQSLRQNDNSIPSSMPKNSGTMMASVIPMTSLHRPSSPAVHKKGQTQISFGGDFKPPFAQMQQIPNSNHSPSPLITTGSPPSSGKLRNNSIGSKTGSSVVTLQSKQDESSSAGGGQKSSPVCGRNVPSILNTCPGHLSELKY